MGQPNPLTRRNAPATCFLCLFYRNKILVAAKSCVNFDKRQVAKNQERREQLTQMNIGHNP
jgi:hypothetical protein